MTLHRALASLESGRRRKVRERKMAANIARSAQYTQKGFDAFLDILDGKTNQTDAPPPGFEVVDFGAQT